MIWRGRSSDSWRSGAGEYFCRDARDARDKEEAKSFLREKAVSYPRSSAFIFAWFFCFLPLHPLYPC